MYRTNGAWARTSQWQRYAFSTLFNPALSPSQSHAVPYYCVSSTTPEDSGSRCGSCSVQRAIRSLWPSPMNWRASLGRCCPVVKTIDISGCSRQQLDGLGKDAALGKHKTLSTFPPPRRGLEQHSTQVCGREMETNESSSCVSEDLWLNCVPCDRGL